MAHQCEEADRCTHDRACPFSAECAMTDPDDTRLALIEGQLAAMRTVVDRLGAVLDVIEPLLPMARAKVARTVLAGYLGRRS